MFGRIGLVIAALAGLSACATTSGEYPSVRYASAAQDGVIAMQIAGRPFEDGLVLRAGDAFQRLTTHHLQVPALAAGAIA